MRVTAMLRIFRTWCGLRRRPPRQTCHSFQRWRRLHKSAWTISMAIAPHVTPHLSRGWALLCARLDVPARFVFITIALSCPIRGVAQKRCSRPQPLMQKKRSSRSSNAFTKPEVFINCLANANPKTRPPAPTQAALFYAPGAGVAQPARRRSAAAGTPGQLTAPHTERHCCPGRGSCAPSRPG